MKKIYVRPNAEAIRIIHETAILDGSFNNHADAKENDLIWKEEVFEEELDKEEDWLPKHKSVWKD